MVWRYHFAVDEGFHFSRKAPLYWGLFAVVSCGSVIIHIVIHGRKTGGNLLARCFNTCIHSVVKVFPAFKQIKQKEVPVARIGCSTWDPSPVSIWTRLNLRGRDCLEKTFTTNQDGISSVQADQTKKRCPSPELDVVPGIPRQYLSGPRLLLRLKRLLGEDFHNKLGWRGRLMVWRFHFAVDEGGHSSRKAPLYRDCLLWICDYSYRDSWEESRKEFVGTLF
ncbi:hypothetical protein CDAR_99141 [Caerostris darwini]|uniref:Uncharacterized protein n=1 Tax=Caerostris darwini TaxID=1538125 RepID=A0AAV4Q4Z4_9ARAC|nr:hypothetical protein CDAR_99141 [Caerostris darwini]